MIISNGWSAVTAAVFKVSRGEWQVGIDDGRGWSVPDRFKSFDAAATFIGTEILKIAEAEQKRERES
jgi:hypothetical protein